MYRANTIKRIIKPEDILIPSGYRVEAFAENLTTPINLTFTDQMVMDNLAIRSSTIESY
jgi:hypothetical protein